MLPEVGGAGAKLCMFHAPRIQMAETNSAVDNISVVWGLEGMLPVVVATGDLDLGLLRPPVHRKGGCECDGSTGSSIV